MPVFDPDPCLCVCCQSSEISRLTAAPDFLFGPVRIEFSFGLMDTSRPGL